MGNLLLEMLCNQVCLDYMFNFFFLALVLFEVHCIWIYVEKGLRYRGNIGRIFPEGETRNTGKETERFLWVGTGISRDLAATHIVI